MRSPSRISSASPATDAAGARQRQSIGEPQSKHLGRGAATSPSRAHRTVPNPNRTAQTPKRTDKHTKTEQHPPTPNIAGPQQNRNEPKPDENRGNPGRNADGTEPNCIAGRAHSTRAERSLWLRPNNRTEHNEMSRATAHNALAAACVTSQRIGQRLVALRGVFCVAAMFHGLFVLL